MKRLRWGIIATGKIAKIVTEDIISSENSEVVAVSSRQLGNAKQFAEYFSIPRYYCGVDELLADNNVDIVYVASPHPFHKEAVIKALQAGKHVLCEKPLTLNALDAKLCIETAHQCQCFLMEAVWMRFFPAIHKVQELLSERAIGEVQMLDAAFCFNRPVDKTHRLFSPELGGGALLDIGIYPISLARMLFGPAIQMTSQVMIGETGVDDAMTLNFTHDSGVKSFLRASTRMDAPVMATIVGTKGNILIHERFHHPQKITLALHHSPEQVFEFPYGGNGYQYEIAEVERCIAQQQLQSELMPWQETLETLQLMDDLRKDWHIRYPGE